MIDPLVIIRQDLIETDALLARLNRELTLRPSDKTILINFKSLEKRKRELEHEYAEISAHVCQGPREELSKSDPIAPSPPKFIPICLNNFKPTFVGENFVSPGILIGSDNGILALTGCDGKETHERFPVSESKNPINGVAGFGDYLAVSTEKEVTIFRIPKDGQIRGAEVIPAKARGILAAEEKHFLAPLGPEGLLVVTPTAQSISENQISSIPNLPIDFYHLCGLPPCDGRYYFAAACRSHGVGKIDISQSSSEIAIRVGAFADVIDVAYLGNASYPYAIAAVGIHGELFLCRDFVRQEPPITLHYRNLAGRVYRVLAGHGHLFILTSKALYVLGNLANRLVQSIFDTGEAPFMTIPMKAAEACIVGDKWLFTVMSDSVNRYDIDLIDQSISAVTRNDVIQQPKSSNLKSRQNDCEDDDESIVFGVSRAQQLPLRQQPSPFTLV